MVRMTARLAISVESADDLQQCVAERDEIDNITIFVQSPGHFATNAIVVPMDALALIAGEGNEMSGAENQLFFFQSHVIGFCHGFTLLL